MHYDYGHLVGYHGMSYIKSNLPKVAIWRSNGFRINPHIAKKSTTLLFSGTFGHTVSVSNQVSRLTVTKLWNCWPGTQSPAFSQRTLPSVLVPCSFRRLRSQLSRLSPVIADI